MSLERGEKRNLVFGREDGGSSGAVKAVKQLVHSPSHGINLFRAWKRFNHKKPCNIFSVLFKGNWSNTEQRKKGSVIGYLENGRSGAVLDSVFLKSPWLPIRVGGNPMEYEESVFWMTRSDYGGGYFHSRHSHIQMYGILNWIWRRWNNFYV